VPLRPLYEVRRFQNDLTLENKGDEDICITKQASLDVVKKMGYSGVDVARFLGVNTSAVNRFAVSDESAEVEKYV